MKKTAKCLFLIIIALIFASALSACSADTAEKLFSLPKGADEYVGLEAMIQNELELGASYSPPASGEYRQSVQFEDLDGDDVDEAIVFLKNTNEQKPLKLFIYSRNHGEFEKAATLEGDGTGFESISYLDMNGDGSDEIVICRQISSGMKILSIYSSKDFQMEVLMSTNFSAYTVCDMSDSKGSDVLVIRETTSEQKSVAEIYSYMPNGNIISSKADISAGTSKLTRLRNSVLSDGKNAVFVEGILTDNSYFTDIFTIVDGSLKNITLNEKTGVSDDTLRAYEVYCRSDNVTAGLKVPKAILIQPQNGMASFRLVDWYSYSSDGEKELYTTTYAPTNEEWRIKIGDLRDRLSYVRSVSLTGEKATVFGFSDENGDNVEVFSIYQISGGIKDERSGILGRFILESGDETVYSGKILNTRMAEKLGITEESLKEWFEIIYSEWKTGII